MAYQKVYMNQIHSSSLLSQLSEMWRRDVLCDAVITTGTVNTKAHRLVLVAACPMLQSMDSASVGNKLEVKLSPDINKAAVISFLQYLYDGFMTLTEDNVRDIEKIARLLQVDSVTKCCNDFYKVLQSTVGQDFGTNQKFPFNTDCAEFKHIKTSDLQRLMQNCSEKRNLDAEEVSLRKKARIQRQSTNSLSKSSGEDSFQLIQTKQNTGNSHSDNSSVHKSVAVSVASRTEATDTNMDVVVVDDNMADSSQGLPSHQLGYSSSEQLTGSTTLSKSGKVSPSSFGTPKPSALHRPYSPSSNRPSSSNAMKSKGGHPSVFKSDLNYNSHKQPIKTQTKNSNAKSQNAWVISHPEKQSTSPGSSLTKTLEDQITIEPMSEEHDSDVSSGMFDSAGQGLSNEPSALERVDESNLDQKENISFAGNEDDNSGRHSPNLSIVKIEKVGESFDLPSGSKDDSYPYKEENEEENSDQEYGHYGDTSQTSFTADDHSTSWYTLNTFKDAWVNERIASNGMQGSKIPYTDPPKQYGKRGEGHAVSGRFSSFQIQQKLIRALSTLKSPVVFLRPLQRKVSCSLKIDVIKDYYNTLDVPQKRAVLGFLECVTNQIRGIDEVYTESTVTSTPATIACLGSGVSITPGKVALITDSDNEEQFASIRVNPTKLRGIESRAMTARNPGQFLLNKIADLIFTREELGFSKGVSSLNSNKMEALQDFLVQNDESPDFEMLPLEEIDDALYRFYQSGMISPDLLNSIPRQLTQHLKATPYCRIVNVETDSIFHTSNFALKAVCSITQPDDGRRKKPMSQDDLNKLYDSGTLSNDNPTGLQNKVWVELMIYIGGLAREDLRRLEKDNFVFEKDDGGHMYYRLDATCMTEAKKQIKVYEQPDNLNCPVRSLWLYLSKLNPQSEVFFQQAIKDAKFEDSVWYTHKPIGKNAHSMWLSTICKEAGITTEYRNQALYCRSAPFKLKMKKDVSK